MLNPVKAIERKIEMNIIASLVERVFKNWIPTVLGFLLGFAGVVAGIYNLIPSTATWHGYNVVNTLLTAAGVAVALAGAIAKNENIGINPPTLPTKVGLFLLVALALTFPATVRAQNGVVVSMASEAVAAHYAGNWVAGNHTTESLDVIDWGAAKGNSFSAEVHEFLLPSVSVNSYLVGGKYVPDLSGILKSTNVTPSQFQLFLQAAGGETTLPALTKSTFMGGGGAMYRATPNLTWTIVDGYVLRFNGQDTWAATAGLVYTINPTASASATVKKLLLKRQQATFTQQVNSK